MICRFIFDAELSRRDFPHCNCGFKHLSALFHDRSFLFITKRHQRDGGPRHWAAPLATDFGRERFKWLGTPTWVAGFGLERFYSVDETLNATLS
jgi:hypothetical protein